MQKNLLEIFSILKNGNQEEVKTAKQAIDKLWRKDRKSFKKHASIVLKQVEEFDGVLTEKGVEQYLILLCQVPLLGNSQSKPTNFLV